MARRSPPAQKARPGTASMRTVFTLESRAHSRNCSKIEAHISWVSALSALGRFSVIWPRAPSRRRRTSELSIDSADGETGDVEGRYRRIILRQLLIQLSCCLRLPHSPAYAA